MHDTDIQIIRIGQSITITSRLDVDCQLLEESVYNTCDVAEAVLALFMTSRAVCLILNNEADKVSYTGDVTNGSRRITVDADIDEICIKLIPVNNID